MKAADGVATAYNGRLEADAMQRPRLEVVVTKMLTAVMAVALVAAVLVGAKTGTVPRAARWGQTRGADLAPLSGPVPSLGLSPVFAGSAGMSRAQGLMPEVVVKAEMPRLVMPTVEVRSFRTVAMSGSDLRAY